MHESREISPKALYSLKSAMHKPAELKPEQIKLLQ